MSFVVSSGLTEDSLAGKYIFLDNDFLSALAIDYESLAQILELSKKAALLIDPLTRFEFLQTVFLPSERAVKESFLANEVFIPAVDHQTVVQQVRANAYTLSYLYGHNGCKGASVVDLFLAGRSALHAPNSVIMTGNRKDFPNLIFDLIGVLSKDQADGTVRNYSVVTFNRTKFDTAYAKWRSLEI